jgi:hypothetical protein|tara:strand:- start:543 stop:731 length:189 start_codon:yes stop_codon:yes gene_type:complete
MKYKLDILPLKKPELRELVNSLSKKDYKKFRSWKGKLDDVIEEREQKEHHQFMAKHYEFKWL